MTRAVKRGRMRRVAIICVSLLLLTALSAPQNRLRGQVRNRSGGGESQCQIDFYFGKDPQPLYKIYNDQNGYFYLDDPKPGQYQVVVSQGTRNYRFQDVSISNDGSKSYLNPDVFVVPW
jgi:hypothetical protein